MKPFSCWLYEIFVKTLSIIQFYFVTFGNFYRLLVKTRGGDTNRFVIITKGLMSLQYRIIIYRLIHTEFALNRDVIGPTHSTIVKKIFFSPTFSGLIRNVHSFIARHSFPFYIFNLWQQFENFHHILFKNIAILLFIRNVQGIIVSKFL